MATCRDWLATLWAASYKGFPFFVEQDQEEGGRRVVIHQFPMRDDPYNEDLGMQAGDFEVSAYVADDTADADAVGLVEVLGSEGAGVLVLPTHGPREVRCLKWKRDRKKDKHGYIAFSLKFVREGKGQSFLTSGALGAAITTAADALGLAAAARAAAALVAAIRGAPDFVPAAAVTGAHNATAALEAIRTSFAIPPADSAPLRDRIEAAFDAAGDVGGVDEDATREWFEEVADVAIELGEKAPPEAAVRAFGDMLDAWAPPAPPVTTPPGYGTPSTRAEQSVRVEVARFARLVALAAYADSIASRPYSSRGEGVVARLEVTARMNAELELTVGAEDAELFVAIQALFGAVIDFLSALITDLAPLVRVELGRSMPSLWVAWRLYADPLRATELVERNGVPAPSFMPRVFEALAR